MNDNNSRSPIEESELKAARKSEAAQREGIENNISSKLRNLKRYIYPAIIYLLGVSLSFFAYYWTLSFEDNRVREALEERAFSDITTAVVNELEGVFSSVQDIESLFAASNFVSRQEFNFFLGHELEESEAIQALEWIPKVPHEEREAYEAAAREDGLLDFQFSELQPQGDMGPRERQAVYFPVYYVEPMLGNEAAVGFDLGSNSERLAALMLARDTGEMVASAPITLVQEQGQQAGFLVFLPIYETHGPIDTVAERRASLTGFALGVFRTGDLINAALEGLSFDSIHLTMYDDGVAAEAEKIYEHQPDSGDELLTSLTTNKVIDVAGRPWRLEITAHPSFSKPYKTSLPWTLLAGGITMTTFIAFAIFISNRHTVQLEQSREALGHVAADMTRLIDSANAPIFGIDRQGLVNEWNQAAVRLTGYAKEEVMGRSLVQDYIASEYQVSVQAVMEKALSGEETENFEFPLYSKGGERALVLLNASSRRDEQGEIVGVLGIGQDITELDKFRTELEVRVEERTIKLNQALEELEEVNRLKTEFLSTAAHELRTPLTSIRGFSEILLTRQLAQDRQTRYMTMINDQASHLAQIIDDLLDISRLEAGRGMEIAPEPIDMTALMNEVVTAFIENYPTHQFRIEGLKEYPALMGDPLRLAQVGQNIFSNAVKYSPQGGAIITHSRVVAGYLEISVQDEGIGMTPAQQRHLFEKFYRADASDTSISGTGLGLAICKSIVELHGGRIWIKSEAGAGTTVFISLPLAESETSPAA